MKPPFVPRDTIFCYLDYVTSSDLLLLGELSLKVDKNKAIVTLCKLIWKKKNLVGSLPTMTSYTVLCSFFLALEIIYNLYSE